MKVLAKDKGIPQNYKLRKAELIEVLLPPKQPAPNSNIPDEPIPEINLRILKPLKPILNSINTSGKNLIDKATISVLNEKINKFSDSIISYVPEPFKNVVAQQVEGLKEQLIKSLKKPLLKNKKQALAGYLKTL